MAAFEYEALDERGRTQKGVATADSARQVRQQLREQGLTPTRVDTAEGKSRKEGGSRIGRIRLSVADLTIITRQFATLIGSDLTVEETLRALIAQSESEKVKKILTRIRAMVMEGTSLTEAIGAFPDAFPGIYRASVLAGEASGKLAVVLERLADFTEARQALSQRVGVALIYPVILMVMAFSIVMFLFIYVVPKVVKVFQDTGQDLPVITQVFIAMTDYLQQYGLVTLVILIAVGVATTFFLRLPKPQYQFHGLLLRIPGIRRLSRGLNTARMARTLAIMVGSGVPLLTAMKASRDVITNRVLRRAMATATDEVREGVSLGKALGRSKLYPPILVQMVSSGEASGKLGEMLDKAASTQERELEARIAVMVGIFEPVMILVMGGIVMLIVLAILLPIFDINQLVQ
ncbi:MAG: type II secretion system inner membrane protein GspF [Gammaproteobacteria bacterium]|nr:type II secretion system inner membrane protein GspF [Gammaproteobacteria bacterium]